MNGKNITYIASLAIFVFIIVYLIYTSTKSEYSTNLTNTEFYELVLMSYLKFPPNDENNQYFYIKSDNDISSTSVYNAFYFPIMSGLDKIENKIWNDMSSNILSIISDDNNYKLITKIKNQYNDKINSERVSFLNDNNTYMGNIKRTFLTYDTLLKIEMRYNNNKSRVDLIKGTNNYLLTRSGNDKNQAVGLWDRWYLKRYPM
jgi:hypothetical protein